jgi:hypothetical protein
MTLHSADLFSEEDFGKQKQKIIILFKKHEENCADRKRGVL